MRVSDPDALAEMLAQLGYEVSIAIDREIVQYDLAGAMIRFEHYPRMDDLVEVEGAPEQIERAIAVLGLRARRLHHRPAARLRASLRGANRTGAPPSRTPSSRETDRTTSPMPDASLPELARSLRSLGAARDPATEAAHDAIFAPLIAARVRAARAEGRDVVHSFHGVDAARGDRARRQRRGRRRDGESSRRPRPLRRRLATRSSRSGRRSRSLDDSAPPRRRRARSRRSGSIGSRRCGCAFAAADEACGHLARVLAEPPREERDGQLVPSPASELRARRFAGDAS